VASVLLLALPAALASLGTESIVLSDQAYAIANPNIGVLEGEGTKDSPEIITNADQLAGVAELVNKDREERK
jgi:hypothetical protein